LFVSHWALAFTAFVGLNLFQFGFTNFCPMGIILRKLGVPVRLDKGVVVVTEECQLCSAGTAITPEQGRKAVEAARARAAMINRTDIKIFTAGYYVCRPTRQEAIDYHRYYVEEHGDFEAYEHLLDLQFPSPEARLHHGAEALRKRHIGGNGSYPMIGSPDDIAKELKMISDLGYDGMAASCVNYAEEFPLFRDEVLPRLERLGLRSPPMS
jgi:alkanesulfonate monooxygenase SsuD/methylene tetrahydromethanopterin reductase-like flavin-dependent oxidoreductase (luciferase family)